jgi:hypothetical protein
MSIEPLHSGSNMANKDFNVLKNFALSLELILLLLLFDDDDDDEEDDDEANDADDDDDDEDDSIVSTNCWFCGWYCGCRRWWCFVGE